MRIVRTGILMLAVALPWPSSAAGSDEPAVEPPYRVEGDAVDAGTYNGYRRYNATCNHCHGPDGIGSSFGPSLIETSLPFDEFRRVVLEGTGSGTSVMQGFAGDPNVEPHVADIHAYLRARADGALGRGRPGRLD